MQNVPNPLVAMCATQLEVSRRFAEAVFSGTEKIDRVMRGATQRAFNEQMDLVQAIATGKDARAVGSRLQANLFARNPDEAVKYQKEIVRIVSEMQNEITRSMQECMDQMRTGATTPASRPFETPPTQPDAAFNPVTSMFSVWESAFKEVAELARKNMSAARSMGAHAGAAQDTAGSAIDPATSRTTHVYRSAPDDAESGVRRERRGRHAATGRKK